MTTTFSGPSEVVIYNSHGNCGDMRTLYRSERLKETLQILNQRGIWADFNTYVCVLNECIRLKRLAEGKHVHAHLIRSGFKPNIFLLNTLANMYAKCGSMVDAHQVFDKMAERDMCTWNILIAGYAKHGCGKEAVKMYEQMQREGVTPNRVTFICVLNACASIGALGKGQEVHADIVRAGIAAYGDLGTALIDMYAKCGSMEHAHQVFDNMARRNVVAWSVMIAGYAQHRCGREAFQIYEQMIREGVAPNRVTFTCILNACASLAALEKGKEVHADIMKAGITSDHLMETALVNMYAKCGSMKEACQVFNNMTKQNVVSFNAMIAGYAQHGFGRKAFKIYEQMYQRGVTPSTASFISVLNACASIGSVEKGKEVHDNIIKAGITPDIILETALLNMYAKCGSMKDAQQVFDSMAKHDVVSWSAMIAGYAHHGCGKEAFKIYEQMQQEGVPPNRVTFICILNACASLGVLERGKEVHADIIKFRIGSYVNLDNALVNMYAKCGTMKDARKVFDNMTTQNLVSWSAMIAGYAQHGFGREAFQLYEEMIQEGLSPNKVTFISILNACASLAALEKGRLVHSNISRSGIMLDTILESTLVDMYAKCGSIKDARQVFDTMAQRNVVSWNAVIAGYAQHGFGREALQLFEQMQQEGLKPDGITFICLLSACSHAGLVNEGRHYFDSLSQNHGLTPTVDHFGCMVDLLGRGGQLDEAEDFMNKLPIQPDAAPWGALLGAAGIHGNVELAERASRCLL